ncbi:MAG: AarF/UbiB family protein [Bacteriovoracales bacterium]|nr:AarF/UbiB family protein [Bacteriovoracales bacterium]
MNIIKKSLEITQNIKNVTRFKEIVGVFAQNGLNEFIVRSGLHKVVPNFVLPKSRMEDDGDQSQTSWAHIIGRRLKKSFEELGPSFIKIGQLLSTREDLFPSEFIDQMKLLRDRAKGIPFEKALEAIDQSLGLPHGEVFDSIDPTPIGTASIGLVYRANLKGQEDVVIKVRRPGIGKIISMDLAIIKFIAHRLEKAAPEIKYLGLSRLVKEFGNNLQNELDFKLEALNAKRIKQNLSLIDKDNIFYIPQTYEELTRKDLLVMEELKGTPFNQLRKDSDQMNEIHEKLTIGVQIFIKTLLSDGLFHADLHGGNFFLLEKGRIGLIDFGLVGHLSKKSRSSLISILYSLTTHNYENLVFEFLDISDYDQSPDIDELIRDIKDTLCGFVGLTAQQINLPLLLNKSVFTLSKHRIYLPREWYIIFRALITLDGVGKSIDLDIDIFSIIEKNLGAVTKEIFSKEAIVEEGIFTSRDLLNSMRIVPRHLRWFTKELSKNNYALKVIHKGHERPFDRLRRSIIFFGYALIAAILVLSGVLTIDHAPFGYWYEVSKASWFFWGLAFAFFLMGVKITKR